MKMTITEAWRYSKAATEAMYVNRYSWGIAKNYLAACDKEDRNLDALKLDEWVQSAQDLAMYAAAATTVVAIAAPIGWILKRRIRKRRKAR